MLNPFEAPKTTAETPSASFDVRRQELSPHVRSYVDTLYVQIRQIFDKYGVRNIEDLRDGVKEKKIKMERTDGESLKELTRWLRDALKERRLPNEPIKEFGEFALENIPKWDKLPSAKILKNKTDGFKFDYVWEQEYYEGRPLVDNWPTADELDDSDVARDSIFSISNKAEAEKGDKIIAKIFSIKKILEQKKGVEAVTTGLVLSAIDEEGYRPATFTELMAYARDHWEPEKIQEYYQGHHCLQLHALGSGIVDITNVVCFPTLHAIDHKRNLTAEDSRQLWKGNHLFLVIRKKAE